MAIVKGIPASPGIAMGKAFLFNTEQLSIPKKTLKPTDIPAEVTRFEDALIKTRAEILDIQRRISEEMGVEHGEIFNAHLLVLEDRMLIEEVIVKLKKEQLNVEQVFSDVLKRYISAFLKMNDEYLRERIADIDDVGKRVLRNLMGKGHETLKDLHEPAIVVSYDLSPSDTASMHKGHVIAFVTDIGGRTSHTAIMARSLEIPAIVGLEVATREIKAGDFLIVDGTHGVIEINPTKEIIRSYEKKKREFDDFETSLLKLKDLPAETIDGRKIELSANIELPDEIPSVKMHGSEGIGLYRTEYFYMNRKGLPTEEEHYEAYKNVAMDMAPYPVVIRTLDLGGDKFLSQLEVPHEMNPFMGWRAIRFCLARTDIFKMQLRAILRASCHGKLKIMYPMISGIDELRQANKLLEEVKAELKKQGQRYDEDIEVGSMIEIPSAALTCDILAKESDFFSIGTNDLIQYSIAVDRVNEKIAYLYEPTHPAILRLIKMIIEAGHKENIWVGMCGEMASEPAYALLLLGLGLDEFSTSMIAISEVKKIIRSVKYSDAKEIVEEALGLSTGKEVEDFAKMKLKKLVPGLFY